MDPRRLDCSERALVPRAHHASRSPSLAPPRVARPRSSPAVRERRRLPAREAGLDALVRCAQSGDAQAFRKVADRFGPLLVRYVSPYVRGDVNTANDVVQDTLLSAWDRIDTIRGGAHLRPWLFRVARCNAITWLRRRGPQGRPMASLDAQPSREPLPGPPPIDTACLPDDLQRAVRAAVERLPPIYRGVVRLHYLHGHTTVVVSGLLNLTQSTVKMRLHRARRMLARFVLQEVANGDGQGRRELADWLARQS